MTTGNGTKANFFNPQVTADAIVAGFPGIKALLGTDAVIFNTSMPYGEDNVGELINIPYFTNIGELDDVVNDGDSLVETSISSAAQQATVRHSGKLLAFTDWARWAAGGGDPYLIASGQVNEAIARRADSALIAAAATPLSDNSNLVSVYSNTTPVPLTFDQVVKARTYFGDEQGDIALLIVHSQVFASMLLQKDSTGRPLLVDNMANNEIPRYCGIPVKVSDRLTVATSGGSADQAASPTHPKYRSIICKRGSLVFWMNGRPGVETDRKIERATSRLAVHVYWAAHRYSQMNNGTHCGVVLVDHNGVPPAL